MSMWSLDYSLDSHYDILSIGGPNLQHIFSGVHILHFHGDLFPNLMRKSRQIHDDLSPKFMLKS